MQELIDAVNAHGVRIFACRLPGDTLGCFVPSQARIYIDTRLTPSEQRVVLAHELGHVTYGHGCDGAGRSVNRRHERQADIFAARTLIDPARYAQLERINPDRHALAEELTVTPELIDFYQRECLTVVYGATYAHPREGIGQWAHRVFHDAVHEVVA